MGKRQLCSGSHDFDEPQKELQAREEEGSFRLVDGSLYRVVILLQASSCVLLASL